MLGNLSTPELSSLLALSPSIDQIGTNERIARIQARSIKGAAKMQGLRMALSMIDLTTLEGKDTPAKVRQLCFKAQHLHDQAADLPTVAAVCVYPSMVAVAKKALGNSGIKVASVSTAFPSGQAPFEVKKLDTLYALDNGADEIDMVVSRGRFLSGDYQFVYDEIAAIDSRLSKHSQLAESGESLMSALKATRTTTQWLLEHGKDQVAVLSGATPYLRQLSTLVGGYVLAESALLVLEATDIDAETVAAKVATARFFCEQLLPAVHGIGASITGDGALLMGFTHESLKR